MSLLVERAQLFATAAHAAINQKRKYTGEDYINHPAEVVSILRCHSNPTPEQVAAAWLHDVVEDTSVSLELISGIFGDDVASLVEQLTDISKPEDGNRMERKRIDREHASKCSPAAADIKLCDIISNTKSIVARDKEFAKVYLAEKRLLLQVLKHGSPTLLKIAEELANAG